MMRYLVYLKNGDNNDYRPVHSSELLEKARSLLRIYSKTIVRDARISSAFIEYDITCDENDVHDVVKRLSRISMFEKLEPVIERQLNEGQAIDLAKQYFNEERYWSAHEVLEQVWKRAGGVEKDILNGIILVCAAFVHFQKNENEICLSIMKRALIKFQDFDGYYKVFNIGKLRSEIQATKSSGIIKKLKI